MPDSPDAPELQDKPEELEAPAPEADKAPEQATSEPFSEHFDPASLPEELRPAYQNLRRDYTQKTQEIGKRNREQILQQALQDEEWFRKAAEAQGYQLPDPEDDEQGDEFDPYDELRQKVEQLEGTLTQRQQAEQAAQYEQQVNSYIDTEIEALEKDLGRDLSEKAAIIVGNRAIALAEDGVPNVRAAYDEFAEALKEDRKRITSPKRRASQAPVGQSGSQKVDLKDDQVRRQALANAIEEAADT